MLELKQTKNYSWSRLGIARKSFIRVIRFAGIAIKCELLFKGGFHINAFICINFVLVDGYLQAAKDKHGYNVEQVQFYSAY